MPELRALITRFYVTGVRLAASVNRGESAPSIDSARQFRP